jgi:hypothetical protein
MKQADGLTGRKWHALTREEQAKYYEQVSLGLHRFLSFNPHCYGH